MKISLRWLKDYVDCSLTAEKLAHKLTMAGLEVEKVETVGKDKVLEIEVTPNRPDCLSMTGVAREVSAVLNKPLKRFPVKGAGLPRAKADITVEDRKGCPRYIGTVIENVCIAPAPAWMADRLASLGLRAIHNVVDITNFCLMETGQPMHAFDYDKLEGRRIVVRRARKGEKLVTIDGEERALDESILVIADARKPVAIAGIMGGLETEVTAATKTVLLESAYFDPVLVRRGVRKLGLSSDSSYRFERGVDMTTVGDASRRAMGLISGLAGGKAVRYSDVRSAGRKSAPRAVTISADDVGKALGTAVTAARIRTILRRLGFTVTMKGKKLKVASPSFRCDVTREADVVEEVARVIGYDQLPSALPPVPLANIPSHPYRSLRETVRQAMRGQGFDEAILYAFTSGAALDQCALGDLKPLRVQNPLSGDQEFLRPHTLPAMLAALAFNLNRGQKDVRLFEIGKVYRSGGEREVLAAVISGGRREDWREATEEPADFYDLKGALETLAAALHIKSVACEPAGHAAFMPGQTAVARAGRRDLGHIGKVHQRVLRNMGIKQDDVYFMQVDLETLYSLNGKVRYSPPTEYPAVTRDISVAVPAATAFARVEEVVRAEGGALLGVVAFKDLYLGDKIGSGQRGLVLSLTYQSPARTLTETEVAGVHERVCRALTERLAAVIR